MLSRHIREKLEKIPTPFYLYDMDLLRETLGQVVSASSKYGYKVHYALKANFDPRIFEAVKASGLGVDCVSGNEVRYSIEAGFPASSIVYAGVGKRDSEIIYSLRQGIFAFNCESRQELEVINSLAGREGFRADVALRINPDVDPLTHRHISTGHADSKFGISYKEIDELIGEARNMPNINICGLHFHIGSQISEPKVYEYLCRRVNTLYKWFRDNGFRFTHINMGGGLAVEYKQPEDRPVPDFEQYFGIFRDNLHIDPPVDIHFELGRSIVAQCGELITRTLFTKSTARGRNVAIVDASMSQLIRPALYHASHAIENLDSELDPVIYTVGGTVCESSDIFAHDVSLPGTRRGDLMSIKTAGAYGASMASSYNLHDLPLSVYSDDL